MALRWPTDRAGGFEHADGGEEVQECLGSSSLSSRAVVDHEPQREAESYLFAPAALLIYSGLLFLQIVVSFLSATPEGPAAQPDAMRRPAELPDNEGLYN